MLVRPRAPQARPRAHMLLVLLTPTWILQTCHRVGRVGMMLQTYTQVLQARPQVLQATSGSGLFMTWGDS
jgi:hypothetical protein